MNPAPVHFNSSRPVTDSFHRKIPWRTEVGFALLLTFAVSLAGEVESVVGSSSQWSAKDWTSEQSDLFGGCPRAHGDQESRLILRYSYYTVEYNLLRENPIWVAHVDTAVSVAASKERTGSDWTRDKFSPDPNVVAAARRLHVNWVRDEDFLKALSNEISGDRQTIDITRDKRRITRGHMASNAELKGMGDEAIGHMAQSESFSLANVSPQQSGNNSPIWSGIEDDTRRLAEKYKAVAIITGPVFRPENGDPIRYTVAITPGALKIPIPSHFFKIAIVQVGNRHAAIGFLVPHEPSFKKADRFRFVKSVRVIEDFAGINVMPDLGRNDGVETSVDTELLDFLKSEPN